MSETARTSSGEWSLVSKTQTKEESEQPSAEAASRLLIGTVMLSVVHGCNTEL